MMESYEKLFSVPLEQFRVEAPSRVSTILERHGISPGDFFGAGEFPADLLSAIRESASIKEHERARDDLVLVMGEWLVQRGCGYWSIGPIDHDRSPTSTVMRLGFGVMNTRKRGFAVLVSWAEDIMTGGSAQMAADLLDYDGKSSAP